MASMIDGEVKAIPTRGITEETAKKYRYSIGKTDKGKWVQIAPYYKDGQLVAQHYRTKDKKFWWAGEASGCELFGQHLFNQPGKMLVITEGEIDALTVSQVQGNKWPVVAITGAEKAPKDIATNLKFLQQYDEIILMFDDDDPGRQAAQKCAKILPFGKAKIATINGYKDANEALMDDNAKAIISAIWNAKAYRPDGIVEIDDALIEAAMIPLVIGLPWWDDRLTQVTFGRRLGEVYGFGGGTGTGKTDWMLQQAAFDAIELNHHVGLIFLEQSPKETLTRLAGKFARRVLHVPGVEVPPEDRRAALEALRGRALMYDTWGHADWDDVETQVRFMHHAQGIELFYLDHLTAMADPQREKESLEELMAAMATLAHELNIIIHYVSHLTTPDSGSHEEGARVTIRSFKGSRAIGYWSHFMFGMERNQQADDPDVRRITTFRVLKDRFTGRSVGTTLLLDYNPEAGMLFPTEDIERDEHGFRDDEDDF